MNGQTPSSLEYKDVIVTNRATNRSTIVPMQFKPNPTHAYGYMYALAVNGSYNLQWKL